MNFTFFIFNLKSINIDFFSRLNLKSMISQQMAASLENLLRESGSTLTKQFHVPCIAHFLNLAIQGGLKELGNSSLTSLCSESEVDEECEEDDEEVTSQRPFRAILHQLRKTCSYDK